MALKEIEVFFFGLICHTGTTGTQKDRALFVDDADHIPEVVTSDGTTIFRETLKKGDTVVFDVAHGSADGSGIDKFAPHLSRLVRRTDGKTPNIIRTKGVAETEYPLVNNGNGTFSLAKLLTANFYDDNGEYRLDGKTIEAAHCVPRVVVLKFTTEQATVRVTLVNSTGNGPSLNVPAGSWLLFANRSKTPGQHFDRHIKLTDARVIGEVIPGKTCSPPAGSGPTPTKHFGAVLNYLNSAPLSLRSAKQLRVATTKDTPQHKFAAIDRSLKPKVLFTSILQQVECSNTNWP